MSEIHTRSHGIRWIGWAPAEPRACGKLQSCSPVGPARVLYVPIGVVVEARVSANSAGGGRPPPRRRVRPDESQSRKMRANRLRRAGALSATIGPLPTEGQLR